MTAGGPSRPEFSFPLAAVVLGAGVAGLVDAFALTRYHVFVANQSGNIVHVGMGLAGHDPVWPASLASMAGFLAGSGVAFRLRDRGAPARLAPAVVEIGLAAGVLLLWAALGRWVVLGGGAMGCLSGLVVRTAGTAVTTTYQSGTVAKTGERIAAWVTGRGPARMAARNGALLGVLAIVGYAAGGACGALAQSRPVWTFGLTLAVLLMLLLMVRHPRR